MTFWYFGEYVSAILWSTGFPKGTNIKSVKLGTGVETTGTERLGTRQMRSGRVLLPWATRRQSRLLRSSPLPVECDNRKRFYRAYGGMRYAYSYARNEVEETASTHC
jgi:hypothetical protein